jgi:uncharacterized membrane protein
MKWYVLLLLVAIDIVYIVIGGVIFHFLESENEDATVQINYNFTRNFAGSFICAILILVLLDFLNIGNNLLNIIPWRAFSYNKLWAYGKIRHKDTVVD